MAKKTDWDDFLDQASQDGPDRRKKCQVCLFLEDLPPEGRTAIEAAMGRPEISTTSIVRTLKTRTGEAGLPGTYSFNRHRRGECQGGRKS